jgi:galactofuranose transport system permease protein
MNQLKNFAERNARVLITMAAFVLIFGVASAVYPNFLSLRNFTNLLINSSYLGIVAIGMTLVISTGSGGIDLSVGAVMGLATMIISAMSMKAHLPPAVIIPVVLIVGLGLGFGMGCMIEYWKVPPFIATLAGQYFARGMCNLISLDQIQITHGFFYDAASVRIMVNPFGSEFISANVVIFFVLLAAALVFAKYSRTGRVIYAMGGNEQSANLMGLPVKRSKLSAYAISGFCSALAGIAFIIFQGTGHVKNGEGLEMDAIAAAVIGGTLLTGGVGPLFGTFFGVLIMGTIQSILSFQGNLSSWWTKIVVGLLIMVSILIQNIGNALRGRSIASERSKKERLRVT